MEWNIVERAIKTETDASDMPPHMTWFLPLTYILPATLFISGDVALERDCLLLLRNSYHREIVKLTCIYCFFFRQWCLQRCCTVRQKQTNTRHRETAQHRCRSTFHGRPPLVPLDCVPFSQNRSVDLNCEWACVDRWVCFYVCVLRRAVSYTHLTLPTTAEV